MVFHLRGKKAATAHPPGELGNELENLMPIRWVRPGVFDLGNEDGVSTTATFDGKGNVKFRGKKR